MALNFFSGKARGPNIDYVAPRWPGLHHLYLGSSADNGGPHVLWYRTDIIKFTLVWTLLLFTAVYAVAGVTALLVLSHDRNKRLGVLLLCSFIVFGAFIGTVAGAIVGQILGFLYTAGYMAMSTWVPLTWAFIQIFSSFTYADNDVRMRTL